MLNAESDTKTEHDAVVFLMLPGLSDEVICTGTLIDYNFVLTASHCVAELPPLFVKHLVVGVGTDLNHVKNYYPVQDAWWHDDYTKTETRVTSDIALLKLEVPVPAEVAQPILPLPPELGITQKEIKKSGVTLDVVGYGVDEKGNSGVRLHAPVNLKMYCGGLNDPKNDPVGCNPGEVLITEGEEQYMATTIMPYGTVFYLQYDKGPCSGDSGGPAFIDRNGVEYLAGITSYGDKYCNSFGVSAAVEDYFDWICTRVPDLYNKVMSVACADGACEEDTGSCSTTRLGTSAPFSPWVFALLALPAIMGLRKKSRKMK